VRATRETKLIGMMDAPPDKSITIRALLLAAIAEATSTIERPLRSEDTNAVLAAVRKLGVRVDEGDGGSALRITGGKLKSPEDALDLRNSGTGLRLLTGICAAREGLTVTLTGDESLRRRPLDRVVEPLRQMGAEIEYLEREGCAPIQIQGRKLKGIRYELPIPSAQVKSALLLAGLSAEGRTEVVEHTATRDHTERMLPRFGVEVKEVEGKGTRAVAVEGPVKVRHTELAIPGDYSSAFLPLAMSLCLPGSNIRVGGLGLNPTRLATVPLLGRAGARWQIEMAGYLGHEPVGVVFSSHSTLSRIEVDADQVPSVIDELPLMALLATQAEDGGEIRGAGELRVKESDRLANTQAMLCAFGAHVEVEGDCLRIGGKQQFAATKVDAGGDHRIAMLALGCALLAGTESAEEEVATMNESEIAGWECADVSWPNLVEDMSPIVAGAVMEAM